MSTRRLPIAAALLVLATGCELADATGPESTEFYVLASIDGRRLPTGSTNDPAANGALILREELVLDDEGVATRRTTVQGSTPGATVTSTVSYTYTRRDGVLTLGEAVCTGSLPCPRHFHEQGPTDGFVLTLSPVPGSPVAGPVLVYQRPIYQLLVSRAPAP